MADLTLQQLIIRTQQELYQAAGIGTQVYGEANISQKILNAFELLAGDPEYKWKRYNTFLRYTLDGTTGRVTAVVTDTFKTFDDIYTIYPADSERQLTYYNGNRNPLLWSGTTPLQYTADATTGKVFRVIPITATGDIVVSGRVIPDTSTFALSDTVPFDSLVLIYMAAWQYAVDDGANQATMAKFQTLFETRLKQMKRTQANEPISLSQGTRGDYPRQWSGEPW
jgi:hypothetical protein